MANIEPASYSQV